MQIIINEGWEVCRWRQKTNDRENWVPVVNKAQALSHCRVEESGRQA
jgi:hypothetical protein